MNLRRTVFISIFSLAFVGLAHAGGATPEPIKDRVRMVGGIESLIIDGRIYYFGFSYKNDLVLSPLIDTPATMSEFAARYMRQTDGVHDEKYWRQLVTDSATNSDLASDVADRTIKLASLRNFVEKLSLAERENQRALGLSMSYHLLYLLEASKEDVVAPNLTKEFQRLDFGESDSPMQMVLESIKFLNGTTSLPDGASYRDAAYVARVSLDSLVKSAPANWAKVFNVLRVTK
jgi:hypothetical protein